MGIYPGDDEAQAWVRCRGDKTGPKIAFIGAGSTQFTQKLLEDIAGFPALADTATLALMDIDAERLRTAEIVAGKVIARAGARARTEATLDRRAALDGADYVVTSFQVGGYRPATVVDFGSLPRQLAALMQTNVNVQGLTVEAALTGRREAVHHAAMLDPHTAAELSLDEIARLVEELLEAHGEWIPT